MSASLDFYSLYANHKNSIFYYHFQNKYKEHLGSYRMISAAAMIVITAAVVIDRTWPVAALFELIKSAFSE